MFIPNKSFKFQGVYYNSAPPPPSPLSTLPFTVKSLQDGSHVMFYDGAGANYINLEYSKNSGAWTSYTLNTAIYLNEGETVAFSGNNPSGFSNGTGDVKIVSQDFGQSKLEVYGNLMSILTGNFLNVNDFSFMQNSDGAFRYLFTSDWYGSIVHASGLILPASSVMNNEYYWMFMGSQSLQTPPQMLATEFGWGVCWSMFMGCFNLKDAPQIFATNFDDTSFANMFNGCSSLSGIKVHFTTWPQYEVWVDGVAANGTFYKPAALPEEYGANRIPNGWTVIDF